MTKEVSEAYAQIFNIINAAKWHRANCRDIDCGVALLHLKNAACNLLSKAWPVERKELMDMIQKGVWS